MPSSVISVLMSNITTFVPHLSWDTYQPLYTLYTEAMGSLIESKPTRFLQKSQLLLGEGMQSSTRVTRLFSEVFRCYEFIRAGFKGIAPKLCPPRVPQSKKLLECHLTKYHAVRHGNSGRGGHPSQFHCSESTLGLALVAKTCPHRPQDPQKGQ